MKCRRGSSSRWPWAAASARSRRRCGRRWASRLVSVNSAALADPSLITRLSENMAARRSSSRSTRSGTASGSDVYGRSGQVAADRDAVEWAIEAERCGAGEILLTSIDRTAPAPVSTVSSRRRYPARCPFRHRLGRRRVVRPLLRRVHGRRADAALAASIFHYSEHAVADLKEFLHTRGVPVRLRLTC